MTAGNRDKYSETFARSRSVASEEDPAERARLEEERKERLREAKAHAARQEALRRAKPAEVNREPIRHNLARNTITLPPKQARRVYFVAVDNSGSNRRISQALKSAAAGYLHAVLGGLSHDSAIAFNFFSDHQDGRNLFQHVDWTMGTDDSGILLASIDNVQDANGKDEAEAIECVLTETAELDFGHIGKGDRHLILVTDVVAHGMGMEDDDGCPYQRNWRQSLRDVHANFASFTVVATGNQSDWLHLQEQFVEPERLKYDLFNMVTGGLSHDERCRLVPNAVLFMIFRTMGNQTVEAFLSGLYEKWLAEPMYGSDTQSRAQAQLRAFATYLEITDQARDRMLERVFGE